VDALVEDAFGGPVPNYSVVGDGAEADEVLEGYGLRCFVSMFREEGRVKMEVHTSNFTTIYGVEDEVLTGLSE
jgi:hypothetical protein